MLMANSKEKEKKTWKTDKDWKKNKYLYSRIHPNVLKSYASRYFILMQRGSKVSKSKSKHETERCSHLLQKSRENTSSVCLLSWRTGKQQQCSSRSPDSRRNRRRGATVVAENGESLISLPLLASLLRVCTETLRVFLWNGSSERFELC